MKALWGRYPVLLGTAVTVLSVVSLSSSANGSGGADVSRIRIKNFGVVCDSLYRGAQPKRDDYQDLAALGIKTVIDLQVEGERTEESDVEAAGMKFFRVGMSDRSWPSADQVDAVLRIIEDPANQPVFLHCRGGHHRTGMIAALHRIRQDNWDLDRACDEMDKYGFHTGMGHGGLKNFVRDYCTRYTAAKPVSAPQVVTTSTPQ